NTIAAFYTTWFDHEFIHGTTDMTVTFHLPDAVEHGELRNLQAPPGWPTNPVTDVDSRGRITYTWNNPAASGVETYLFDVSFPKDKITEAVIVRPLQIFTLYAWAYANRGYDFSELGDQDRAIADYDKAIVLNPLYVRAYTLRGIAHSEQDDFDIAIADYNRSLDLDPEYPWAYMNRGYAYYEQGDFDRGFADYDLAIRFAPELSEAYNIRGVAHTDQGNLDRALADFTKAINLNPQFPGFYLNRAQTYEDMGEVELAIADYTRYLELSDDPDHRAWVEMQLTALQRKGAIRDDTVCEAIQRNLIPNWIFGDSGNGPGQFNHPVDVAINQVGEIYITDSLNHRTQHLNSDGEILHIWGEFASIAEEPAPGGTFNEPWGIAVAPDGSVYVADTWNHRIQFFTSTGEFLGMFGSFGSGEELTDMWGPRDVVIDSLGRLYVADTGFKRIVIFDSEGNPLGVLSQGSGSDEGELDEPVGITLSDEEEVFVADTWNQRVQIFSSEGQFLDKWPVPGWYGNSMDNKPYLALDNDGQIFITDPEGYKVLVLSEAGDLLYCFGEEGTARGSFGLPLGLAYDGEGGLYVLDAGNDRLMHFTLED
ncbi:MAG: tetratricopeptide repeat protein, partial [Anaerolineales bacterium]|nr:tetratricopeptide repeat protein [Anaerolineales bacterium]